MRKILLGAAALAALGVVTIAVPADAAQRNAPGIQSKTAIDLSAVHRPRHLRYGSRWVAPRYGYVRPAYPYVRPAYRYYAGPGPYWGGYPYGPYYRPWYRPSPFPFLPFIW